MTQNRQQPITRTAVVTVATIEKDQYGNLKFTDTEGGNHKLGVKRPHLFDQVIVGRAVKLGYSVFNNNEYISQAGLFDGQPDPPKDDEIWGDPVLIPPPALVKQGSSPEVGMCWNNVGNRIGDGSIDRDYPKSATKIKGQYYKYIFGVTGIKLEKED